MIPSPMNPTASRAMPATSRCLDPQPLAGPQATGRLGGELLAVEQVAPPLARLPAVRARRSVPPALREQREVHRRQRLQLADDPVAPAEAPRAARAAADRVGDHAQRELELERLDGR